MVRKKGFGWPCSDTYPQIPKRQCFPARSCLMAAPQIPRNHSRSLRVRDHCVTTAQPAHAFRIWFSTTRATRVKSYRIRLIVGPRTDVNAGRPTRLAALGRQGPIAKGAIRLVTTEWQRLRHTFRALARRTARRPRGFYKAGGQGRVKRERLATRGIEAHQLAGLLLTA